MSREEVVRFGKNRSLVGILTPPDGAPLGVGLLLLNAGIVHHVGLQRLYVELARRLAHDGIATLRFDFSGVGDSDYRTDGVPFVAAALDETRRAMSVFERETGVSRFLLAGLCSGAVIAFRTALEDERPRGVALVNPIGHLHGSECRVPPSYIDRVRRRHFARLALRSSFRWKIARRVLSGRVDYSSFLKAVSTPFRRRHTPAPIAADAPEFPGTTDYRKLVDRGIRVLQIHAEADEGLDYIASRLDFPFTALGRWPGIETEVVRGANHTFTPRWAQRDLLRRITSWAIEVARGDG